MIFVYFILGCIILGLISYFIIGPLSEKEVIKRIFNTIVDVCLTLFIIYVFFATLFYTTDLINQKLNIENGGILALLIIGIFTYGILKRFNK